MSRSGSSFRAATRHSGTRLAVLALLLEAPWLAACWTPVCLKGPDPLPFRGESLGVRCERHGDCRQGECIAERGGVSTCQVGEAPCPPGAQADPVSQRCTTSCKVDTDCQLGTIAGSCVGTLARDGKRSQGTVYEHRPYSEINAKPGEVPLCRTVSCWRHDMCPAGYRCVGGSFRDDGLRSWTSPFSCRAGFCQVTADRDERPPAADWEDR